MPIKVERPTDYFVDTEVEEVAQLVKEERRKHHPSAHFGHYLSGSFEMKGKGILPTAQYDVSEPLVTKLRWVRTTSHSHQPKIRGRSYSDYIPVNLVTSIEELGSKLAEIKECLEELDQRSVEAPNKWVTQIRDLGDESYKLVEPILVLIEEYPDDSVIARFPEIEVFGEGTTDSEAILNLKSSILDLFDELTETDPKTLGKLPRMWLRILERIIIKNDSL